MFKVNVKLKILLLAATLLLVAAPQPAQALPAGKRAVATRVSISSQGQQQVVTWWRHIRSKLSRYAMAAN